MDQHRNSHRGGQEIRRNGIETEEAQTTAHGTQTQSFQNNKKGRRFQRRDVVLNLSKKHLTRDHKSVLNKGLKFIPTPNPDHKSQYLTDYLCFERKLRLKYHFSRQDDSQDESDSEEETFYDAESIPQESPLNESSGWTPNTGQDPHLDYYCSLTTEDVIKEKTSKPKRYNLTLKERQALKDLTSDETIVIKPADKGGKIVVMNKEDYEGECLRQLSDETYYQKVPKRKFDEIQREIKAKVSYYSQRGLIDQEIAEKLYNPKARIPPFYTIPKIHKENNPGRPIIAGIQSPTENLSYYVDYHIKYYAHRVESYIKDTNHFLRIIEDYHLEDGDIIGTLDVKSLYTNIRNDEGLTALKNVLSRNGHTNPEPGVLENLASVVLKNNIFRFKDDIYLQKQGTAMGTRMAPSYAIIYMAEVEENLLARAILKPELWKRFIDDIFFIWKHGEESLKRFVQYLNDSNEAIQFTVNYSNFSVPFLDVKVFKGENGKLETTLFIKDTDACQYLHYHSTHPRHQKDNIPFGQFLRAKKICSQQEDFEYHARRMYNIFRDRNYSEDKMTQALAAVRRMNRADLIKDKEPERDHKLRLVTNFNPANPNLKQIIHKHDRILQSTRRKVINPEEFQIAYSRCKNLRDILVHSDHTKTKKPPGSYPCNKPCTTCALVSPTNTITSKYNKTFKLTKHLDCQSSYTVYIITCKKCGLQYTGETSQTTNKRLRAHVSTINTKKDTPVANHFNNRGHSKEDISLTIVDQEFRKNRRLRLEESWMLILDTRSPSGINARN